MSFVGHADTKARKMVNFQVVSIDELGDECIYFVSRLSKKLDEMDWMDVSESIANYGDQKYA